LRLSIVLFCVVVQGRSRSSWESWLLGVFSLVAWAFSSPHHEYRGDRSMIMMTLTFPMMFLSGVFFPISRCRSLCSHQRSSSAHLPRLAALRQVVVLGWAYQQFQGTSSSLWVSGSFCFSSLVDIRSQCDEKRLRERRPASPITSSTLKQLYACRVRGYASAIASNPASRFGIWREAIARDKRRAALKWG